MRTGKSIFAMACIGTFLGGGALPLFPQSCTVHEDRILYTQSAQFRIGNATVSLTLPIPAYGSGPTSVFLEVSGTFPPGLLLETGSERAPLVDGDALHFMPSRGERNEFRLVNPAGATLCAWTPHFRWVKWVPTHRDRGISDSNFWLFRNLGEPLFLSSVGALHAAFTLGDIPAKVLSRQRDFVILRDPKPSYGRRAVWSPGAGEGVPLRFIQLDMEFSKRPPKGNAVLKIHAPKLEFQAPLTFARMRRSVPYMPPIVMLLNERRDIVELRCGSEPTNAYAFLGDVDLDQRRSIVIQPKMMRDRLFTAGCPVVFRKEGPVRIWAAILEVAPPQ